MYHNRIGQTCRQLFVEMCLARGRGDVPFLGLVRTIYIQCIYSVFLAGKSQIYGHIRCIHTVLANPSHSTTQGPHKRCNLWPSHDHSHAFCVAALLAVVLSMDLPSLHRTTTFPSTVLSVLKRVYTSSVMSFLESVHTISCARAFFAMCDPDGDAPCRCAAHGAVQLEWPARGCRVIRGGPRRCS